MKHFRFLHYFLKDKNNYEKDEELSRSWDIYLYYLDQIRLMSWYLIRMKLLYFIKYKKVYIIKLISILSILLGIIFFGGKYVLEHNPFIEIKKAVVETPIETIYVPDTISISDYTKRMARISGASVDEINSKVLFVISYSEDSLKTSDKWLKALAQLESKQDIKAENGQYWGAWQMGQGARNSVNMGDFTKTQYLESYDIQELSVKLYTKKNYEYLKRYIKKHENTIMRTYHLTQSGMLAMAHNCGPQGVVQFLESGGSYIPKDGNGVASTNYLTLGNYNIQNILGE